MLGSIDEKNFVPEVLASNQPVMVASLKPGLAHRKQLLVMAWLGAMYGGVLKTYVAHDNSAEILADFGVSKAPSFLLFDRGKVVGRYRGKASLSDLRGLIVKYANKSAWQ
jgi:thioredoxin-like negative regulator of GroEL